MKIIIRGNEFVKLSENAKQHMQERVGELEKLFNKSENPCATVFCKGKALDRNEVSVEITIPMKHLILRSECSDETLYGALELAIDKIEKQLLRHKKKVDTMIHKREGIAYAFSDFVEENQEPEEELDEDWICPYCGGIDRDAFELADSEDERECPYCGSIVAYERVVTVEYRVKPVKKVAITKIQ